MGTGWRRAFCTTIPRDPEHSAAVAEKQANPSPGPSPRSCAKLGFLSGGSNPSTPRLQSQPVSSPGLRCRTAVEGPQTPTVNESPRIHGRTCSVTPRSSKSPRTKQGSNPSSPRSPLKLSLFKNSFKFRSSCGICLNSVKTGQGTAIYTAECSHAFHFPCIASYIRKHGSLVCPVCSAVWKEASLLAVHKDSTIVTQQNHQTAAAATAAAPFHVEEKKMIESSPRAAKSHRPEPPSPRLHPDTRSYDDDEPLLSPTAGARFIPIPETNEEDDEDENDNEEFQGSFVNPGVKSDQIPVDTRDFTTVQVKVLPEAAVISSGRGYETRAVALRVKAPPPPPALDPSHRAPIDLVTVLDVSGSMSGAKLQMLKRAMRLVISSLGSADRLSIVAFSASPRRLLPLRRMTAQGQRAARRIVDRLGCGHGTSVGEALRKAAKVLEDRRERNPVASIMLLSDGQDDRVAAAGPHQRQGSSHAPPTRFAHIEIPVHSFGFGRKGGFSHEPAEDAFAKCVGGLLSVVAQDLRVQLGFASGSAPGEIAAVYSSCNGRPTSLGLGPGPIKVGDLYAEEERELLVELRVPTSAFGSHHVISARCTYRDPATQEIVCGRDHPLVLPRPHAAPSSVPRIERLRNLFVCTRAVAEARRLAEHGEHGSAHHLLASSRALVLQYSSAAADAEEYVRALEAELTELHWRRQQEAEFHRRRGAAPPPDDGGDPLTPSSAWRAAEKLAKVAIMKKSLNRVSDLHGFENARF